MAHRSDDDVEPVRSGSSPLVDEDTPEKSDSPVHNENETGGEDVGDELSVVDNGDEDVRLPQCKIKRNYSCNLCPFFSQNPRSFLYHSRDVHFDRIKIYECSYCLYASKHSQKLQRHINMIHVAGKNRLKRGVRLTTKELRPIRPKPLPPQTYILREGSMMSDEQEPTREPQIEDESEIEEIVDGEYKCSLCHFKNKSQKLMRRHKRIVHLKKRFLRCSKCSYMTHVKARYTKHVKYHSMPMIKCDLCDFRTPYKWNLDRHYKNHCGSGAFQCSKCNFRADIRQSLTVHEMNHHVPPVGQGAIMVRKKNKGGTSATPSVASNTTGKGNPGTVAEGNGESKTRGNQKADTKEEQIREKRTSVQGDHSLKSPFGNKRETTGNSHLQGDFIHPDDIVPRYGQIFVKNLKCKFCSYKAVFSHEIYRHEKRIHGYIRPENKKANAPKRPPPKLIPIQSKTGPGGPVASPILKIPEVKSKSGVLFPDSSPVVDKSVNENEFHEMCKKSSLTSSLKDFVSLIGDEEGLKTIPDSSREEDFSEECSGSKMETTDDGEFKDDDLDKEKQTDLMKKKNASFFDKLKEKLMTSSSEEQSLFCEECAHESKCLSEAVAHQKRHSSANNKSEVDGQSESDVVVLGVKLSSTRCQHCRQRCKTSTDLFNHLKSCKAFGAAQELQTPLDEFVAREIKREPDLSDKEDKQDENENSMENRVFVWNDLGQTPDEGEEGGIDGNDDDDDDDDDGEEGLVIDIPSNEDTRTDSDSVSTRLDSDSVPGAGNSKEEERGKEDQRGREDETDITFIRETENPPKAVKNVFKCPHCSFWASTASRFHVHIVGHLNKKPFECSLCMYRSNWRWDITKHIRLKSARDPSHLEARVNMTDETGRRNYSKYSKYLTLMKVQEPTAESSGTGKRSGKPVEVTQGNVNGKDVITLPALPRLTRAPTPGTSNPVPEGVPLRPPPPLKAAHQVSSNSPAEDQPEASEDSKKSAKKTLWKCKRCDFRHSDKHSVLSHVKVHYGKKKNISRATFTISEQFSDESNQSQDTGAFAEGEDETLEGKLGSKISFKEVSYRCGHCHQVSPWKHVIQRHCRLKHKGNALIEVGWRHEEVPPSRDKAKTPSDTTPGDGGVKLFLCDICPFTTDSEGNLTAHKLNHIDRPGSIFKCTHCPFYVPSKIAVLEHMQLHGVFGSRFKVPNSNSDEVEEENSDDNLFGGNLFDRSPKKFKCKLCPYVSCMKTQFLYHKRLHIPRNTPFKCKYCSYNVTRPHLLREHLKVHSIVVATESSDEVTEEAMEETITTTPTAAMDFKLKALDEIDQKALHDIPLVWVLRAENWKKMFKCRHCPHMNARKTNIQEHERMHQGSEKKTGGGDSEQGNSELRCADCNYSCNNPGVLASHVKVHQEDYGLIACLVDRERPDAEQIAELQNRVDVEKRSVTMSVKKVETKTESVKKVETETGSAKKVESETDSVKKLETQTGSVKKVETETDSVKKVETETDSLKNVETETDSVKKVENETDSLKKVETETESDAKELQQKGKKTQEDFLSSQPENAYRRTTNNEEENADEEKEKKVLSFCDKCPARFFFGKELTIHSRFHGIHLPFQCVYCTYTARQRPHLLAHYKVHSQEYKEKTDQLVTTYDVSEDCPRPQTSIIANESDLIEGPVWMVTSVEDGKEKSKSEGNANKPTAKFACHLCPAKLFKFLALQYHLTLHGSSHFYKCKYCDYSVKTQGNLTKHQSVHENESDGKGSANSIRSNSFQRFARESVYRRTETRSKSDDSEATKKYDVGSKTKTDPQFGSFMPGSPEFIYPTCLKNGRVREKKYKCPKCPSAFEKREQYKIHVSLHGSKQKYECKKCDYSVKYFANFTQHVKKHKIYEQTMKSQKLKDKSSPPEKAKISEKTSVDETSSEKGKDEYKGSNYELTLIEQQTVLLHGKKKALEEERKTYSCHYCPYLNGRKDNVSNHARRHFCVSGVKTCYRCPHCDYSANQANFIRDHVRLHFGRPHWPRAEAFLKCDKMELWCSVDRSKEDVRGTQLDSKILVFRDRGEDAEDRFFPPLPGVEPKDDDDEEEEEDDGGDNGCRIYVDPENGLPNGDLPYFTSINDFPVYDNACDLVEKVEVSAEESKIKTKRLRGKNWKCKKCPHAFGKKDQYLRHISLHGSNQKHNCDICDYSVKFYTNYVQHMRMHQNHEPHRIICVKKNFQSLDDNSSSANDLIGGSDCLTEPEHAGKPPEVDDVESDSFLEAERKLTGCKYDETDQEYSSSTDETEMCIDFKDDGPSADEDEHPNKKMKLDEEVPPKS